MIGSLPHLTVRQMAENMDKAMGGWWDTIRCFARGLAEATPPSIDLEAEAFVSQFVPDLKDLNWTDPLQAWGSGQKGHCHVYTFALALAHAVVQLSLLAQTQTAGM